MKSNFVFAHLLVDGKVKEWTNGEAHAITDRTFVIRRALRLNDSLPGDKSRTLDLATWTLDHD